MTQPKEQLIETIQRAIADQSESGLDDIRDNGTEWLRALLEENERMKRDKAETMRLVVERDKHHAQQLQQTKEELAGEQRKYINLNISYGKLSDQFEQVKEELERAIDEMKKQVNRNDLQREVNLLMEKRYHRVKAERDRLRVTLEDIADYQHRWSDSPIREVQKIARDALQSSYPPREKGADNE